MTYCLAMKVEDGLVGIADTRITSGNEYINASKVTIHQTSNGHSMFLMTSGLRSVRDKALTYFREVMEHDDAKYNKLYKMVNSFAEQVRRVADEDKKALSESGVHFNLFALVGGQLEDDEEPKLYMLYPEGNWVEASRASPFFIIGNSGYGKPLLKRSLKYESDMEFALKVGFLSFDSTRISANDVGYPIDIIIKKNNHSPVSIQRYEHEEMNLYSQWWQENLSNLVDQMPSDWVRQVFSRIGERNDSET